jgi:hypothetical protein
VAKAQDKRGNPADTEENIPRLRQAIANGPDGNQRSPQCFI